MNINFFDANCQSQTSQSKFGLCDDSLPSNNPAYIDTVDCHKWIANVDNANELEVIFTAIDNCIEIRRPNGEMDNRCDGMITYQSSIIFIELKERDTKNSIWVGKGEDQLRKTISVFRCNYDLSTYNSKKAYIANNKKPDFQSSQMVRMQRFKDETDFILMIQNSIKIG